MDKVMLKMGMILVGVILICSLIGIGVGFSLPTEKTEEVIKANYNHQGEFIYQGYSAAKSAQPNPVLFPQIIEEMEILFSSSGIEGVEMKAILEDKNGSWQKEILLRTTGGSAVLDIEAILELGEAIGEELNGRSSSYLLKIVAEGQVKGKPFTAALEGELSSSVLKWHEDSFNKIEKGFPGEENLVQAAFGYRVKLKENKLFGPITLQREPDLLETAAVSPDISLFAGLVEFLDIDFNYQFTCDIQIDSLEQEVKVWLEVGELGRWKKSFTLLEPTKAQNDFAFSLDLNKLGEMVEDINQEIGGRGAKEQEITIFAQVHTVAETSSDIVDEVFEHQLRGKIGETIAFGVAEKEEEEAKGLILTREGTITKEITRPNLISQNMRKSSLIGLGVSFPIFCVLAYFYWRRREIPSFLEDELKRNRKKYKELISEVTNFPPTKEGETIIDVSSLEDLVNISNNSLKPILLKVEPEKHTYWIVDGLTRYCHVVKEG